MQWSHQISRLVSIFLWRSHLSLSLSSEPPWVMRFADCIVFSSLVKIKTKTKLFTRSRLRYLSGYNNFLKNYCNISLVKINLIQKLSPRGAGQFLFPYMLWNGWLLVVISGYLFNVHMILVRLCMAIDNLMLKKAIFIKQHAILRAVHVL